jgi:competence protein ComGC
MKLKRMHNASAFTRVELIVVIAVLLVLISQIDFMITPASAKRKAQRISCLNNLKQIGTAYRIWSGDHGDRNPALESVSKGGWSDLLTNADQGPNCWTNYAILADDLGRSPKLVMCSADDRIAASDFVTNGMQNESNHFYFQNNTNLSYFVGVSANSKSPRTLLGGDRNLGGGIMPDSDYGFSPKNGRGNDVAVPISDPVSWSLKMHSAGDAAGTGNILLADGSAHKTSSASFVQDWLNYADPTTNWPPGHVPASPSIRLIVP